MMENDEKRCQANHLYSSEITVLDWKKSIIQTPLVFDAKIFHIKDFFDMKNSWKWGKFFMIVLEYINKI